MKQINLNSLVTIELTTYGELILLDDYIKTTAGSKALSGVEFDDVYHVQDWKIEMELWRVMTLFGPYLHHGATVPPIRNLMIYINDDDVKTCEEHGG